MLDVHYQMLANEIVALCPANFREARLEAAMDEGVSRFSLTCRDEAGETSTPRIGGLQASNVDDALHALRAGWPGTPWSKGIFTLTSDGTFKFDVEYDD